MHAYIEAKDLHVSAFVCVCVDAYVHTCRIIRVQVLYLPLNIHISIQGNKPALCAFSRRDQVCERRVASCEALRDSNCSIPIYTHTLMSARTQASTFARTHTNQDG